MTEQRPSDAASPKAPATSGQVIVERPPDGLAQGQYAWPAWWIGGAGGLGVALGLYYLVRRGRRR